LELKMKDRAIKWGCKTFGRRRVMEKRKVKEYG
jgi:hypothetical protein